MAVEVELVGTSRRWRFEKGPVTLGRDPASGIELAAADFPSVSRTHAVLRLEGGPLRIEDLHSGNGTFVNGVRVTVAELSAGDLVRLGLDGPELRVIAGGPLPATVRAAGAAAAVTIAASSAAATIAAGAAATVPAPAAPFAAATIAAPVVQPAAGRKRADAADNLQAARRPSPDFEAAASAPAAAPAWSGEQLALLERGLAKLQRLLGVTLVLVLFLVALVFYQSQQISANRTALDRMHSEAQNAVGAFMPQLDQRLSAFEARLDGVDGKIQAAEDQFMVRLNKDLPALLDRYIAQRIAQMAGRIGH